MRPIILTLAALIVLNLVMPACTPAQSTTKKGSEETIASAQRDAEATAKEAQEQTETTIKNVQNLLEQVQKSAGDSGDIVLPTKLIGMPLRAAQTILVIPVDQIKQEDLAVITEDLGVMCRVLEKKLQQEARIEPAKRTLFPFGADTGTEGIYLEGYGVLLLLNVDFPLIPPPETKKEGPPKEEGDTFWEETKSELHSTREDGGFAGGGDTMIYMMSGSDHPSEEYDPEKVEQLKTTLIKSLKHAANIHCLKPDESVVISVRGCAPAVVVQETAVEEIGGRSSDIILSSRVSTSRTTRRTPHQKLLSVKQDSATFAVLTLRAKKADIDIFSKGKATFDQFRQKVRIHTYQTSGRNMISEPSQR